MSNSTPSQTAPAPGSGEKLDRLKTLLHEMFQLDRGDLDFGLYRIMNLKAAEVTTFLDRDLLPQVKTALRLTSNEERAALEEELKTARTQAWELGIDIHAEPPPKIVALNRRLAEMKKDADAEADVYNHLANFFARYYTEGDFVSQRRYSSGGQSAYLIPYDGEEVKLHWANADQYYVKTTENYASYAFTVGAGESARRVRFETAAADNEKDNVKEANGRQRRFVLARGKDAAAVEDGELVVRFEHRPLTEGEKKRWPGNGVSQQGLINQATVERILNAVDPDWQAPLSALAPTNANGERTLLSKHVDRYTAKNSFDYFIHKDLGGFLRRELDLYLNTEVLNLDDLEQGDAPRLDRALARVRAMRYVGGKIIDFLAQLEDFQKRLWLKKKFVLETNWCVTLDRVPEALYPEVAANRKQCGEWVELFAVDEVAGDLTNGNVAWSDPPSVEFLKANPFLVLDTRHFDRDFTDRLLTALSDAGPLDEQTNGLLVHGENFQALNLLQARYRGQVQCVYIDPPYNTESSSILYKNDLKDSSWLSLMENRLPLAKALLVEEGVLCCAIDDEEVWRLRALLQDVFDKEIGVAPVRSTPIGRTSVGKLSPTHEYALFYGSEKAVPGPLLKTEKEKQRYPLSDESGRYAWRNLLRTGTNDRRADRPKLFYPIFVSDDDTLRIPKMEWDEQSSEYRILEQPRKDETVVWPVKEQDGTKIEKNWERGWERVSREATSAASASLHRRWERGWERVSQEAGEYRVQRNGNGPGTDGISIHFMQRMDVESTPKTWWGDSKYASSNHGARVLKELFGDNPFDFPKSVALVEDCIRASGGGETGARILDFFAGSGATGHAVVNLNREDGGQQRYTLVEIGRHFDTIILPRMKKVVYSPDWRSGKPVSRNGVSQLFKYVRLESYEDTMDSLVVTPLSDGQKDLLAKNPELAEDYRLRYSLGVETSNSAALLGDEFRDPFAYIFSVVHNGGHKEVSVDLPETFNYLIGLRVESRRRIDGVLTITGMDPEGRHCLILWRNLDEMDYAALDAWFDRNRKRFASSLELIYTNGDHTLNAMQRPGETWTAETIEPVFRELMFDEDTHAAAAR